MSPFNPRTPLPLPQPRPKRTPPVGGPAGGPPQLAPHSYSLRVRGGKRRSPASPNVPDPDTNEDIREKDMPEGLEEGPDQPKGPPETPEGPEERPEGPPKQHIEPKEIRLGCPSSRPNLCLDETNDYAYCCESSCPLVYPSSECVELPLRGEPKPEPKPQPKVPPSKPGELPDVPNTPEEQKDNVPAGTFAPPSLGCPAFKPVECIDVFGAKDFYCCESECPLAYPNSACMLMKY